MQTDGRARFAEQVATLREQAGLSLAEVATAAHVARGYVHHLEHGRRWPTRGVAQALDNALDAEGDLVAAWEAADALPKAAAVPVGPEDRERVALAARQPRRIDAATIGALADVLAATRRLEDQIGSAAVLPGVRAHRALACGLLADARHPIRDQAGVLAGELHQYLGWLLAESGHSEQAQRELDAALALGVEFEDPDLTSLALSFKGHLAWMLDDPHGVIALSCAARRDPRVFVAQHAYNAYQEARGWAMAGEPTEVDRILGRADELAERAVARQADAPPHMYWYGVGFFTLQRGFTWHTLNDPRFAQRAATELTNGLDELPEAERHSEWAAIFAVSAAEAFTTAGEAELALAHAHQALAVCRATRSTRLADALRRAQAQMRDTWPTHAPVRDLADEIRSLNGTRCQLHR
ncbi:MAG: helix-turn-helix domain-containing protein [Pseudonocardiales bacterium]|nr:helix-turn-helix domain-containing protein [Pseudonocardiales bacterium]